MEMKIPSLPNSLIYNNNSNSNENNKIIINNDYLISKKENIESLFLFQNFENSVIELINLLFNLYNNNNRYVIYNISSNIIFNDDNNNNNNNSGEIKTLSLSNNILESFSKFNHTCKNNDHYHGNDEEEEECQCRWIMELLIQSLYELGKPSDALKLVNRFYFDGISNAPINILILSIQLLVYLKSYDECKVIIFEALKRNKNEIKQDQYEQLIELLIFHIMFRKNEINESITLLQNDSNLTQWKKEGFIKALYEMVQIREIEEKNQRELQLKKDKEKQQQQQQQLNQQQEQEQQQKQIQQQPPPSSPSSPSSSPSLPSSTSPSILKQIKDILNESIHEILSIRDFNSLKLAINRIIFNNIRLLILKIYKSTRLLYLKSKLFYLKNNNSIRRIISTSIAIIVFISAIKRLLNNQNNNNNTKRLPQQAPQQQQVSQNLNNNNNKRSFGMKNVQSQQQQQPYRNSQHYQQFRSNNNNNSIVNRPNTNNNSFLGSVKQLLSNTFTFNRV